MIVFTSKDRDVVIGSRVCFGRNFNKVPAHRLYPDEQGWGVVKQIAKCTNDNHDCKGETVYFVSEITTDAKGLLRESFSLPVLECELWAVIK